MKINSVSKYDMTDVGSAYGQISGKKAEIAKMEGAWIGQSFEVCLPVHFPYCKHPQNSRYLWISEVELYWNLN